MKKGTILIIISLILIFCVISAGCTKALKTKAIVKSAENIERRADSADKKIAQNFSQAMDYTNPTTRDFALKIIPKSHSGKYSISQVCDIWDYVNSRWTYVNDPNGLDYRSPASRTINIGLKGDCDDFAVLIASLTESIGGSSRIVRVTGHAYPEVYLSDDKEKVHDRTNYISKRYNGKTIHYHTEKDSEGVTRYWLNLDRSANYPGGPFNEADMKMIIYPDGTYKKYD